MACQSQTLTSSASTHFGGFLVYQALGYQLGFKSPIGLLPFALNSIQMANMRGQFRLFSPGIFLMLVSVGYCLTGWTGLHQKSIIGTLILSNFLMVSPYELLHAVTQCTIHHSCSISAVEHIDYSEFTEIRQLSLAVFGLGLLGVGTVVACMAKIRAGIYLLNVLLVLTALAALWNMLTTLHAGGGAGGSLFWFSALPVFWTACYWVAGNKFLANRQQPDREREASSSA
jgi:hypothetical protein